VILVDDHRRHVAVADIGKGEGGALADIDDRGAIERIPVRADCRLSIDGHQIAEVVELVHPTGEGNVFAELDVCRGTDEIVDGDRDLARVHERVEIVVGQLRMAGGPQTSPGRDKPRTPMS
jgi:hypothetical protein